MAFKHGSKATFWLDSSVPTLTDISTYVTSVTFSPECDTAECSTMGATVKSYVAGLKGTEIELEGLWDPTVDAIMNAALGFETRTFEYRPQGVGGICYSGECVCTEYEIESPVDDVATWSATLQTYGTVSRA